MFVNKMMHVVSIVLVMCSYLLNEASSTIEYMLSDMFLTFSQM